MLPYCTNIRCNQVQTIILKKIILANTAANNSNILAIYLNNYKSFSASAEIFSF